MRPPFSREETGRNDSPGEIRRRATEKENLGTNPAENEYRLRCPCDGEIRVVFWSRSIMDFSNILSEISLSLSLSISLTLFWRNIKSSPFFSDNEWNRRREIVVRFKYYIIVICLISCICVKVEIFHVAKTRERATLSLLFVQRTGEVSCNYTPRY